MAKVTTKDLKKLREELEETIEDALAPLTEVGKSVGELVEVLKAQAEAKKKDEEEDKTKEDDEDGKTKEGEDGKTKEGDGTTSAPSDSKTKEDEEDDDKKEDNVLPYSKIKELSQEEVIKMMRDPDQKKQLFASLSAMEYPAEAAD